VKNSETFAKAAKYMSDNGMHKGNYVDPEGGRAVCLFGACFMANDMKPVKADNMYGQEHAYGFWSDDVTEVENAVIGDLAEVMTEEGITLKSPFYEDEYYTPSPSTYNDQDETTLEDVLLILKKAEVKAREREEKEEASTDEDSEV